MVFAQVFVLVYFLARCHSDMAAFTAIFGTSISSHVALTYIQHNYTRQFSRIIHQILQHYSTRFYFCLYKVRHSSQLGKTCHRVTFRYRPRASMSGLINVNATSALNIARLVKLLPADLRTPRVGIVCGSGLGTLAESITERVIVPYSVLEGFAESTGASLAARTERFTKYWYHSPRTSKRACVWKSWGRAGSCDAWTSASILSTTAPVSEI